MADAAAGGCWLQDSLPCAVLGADAELHLRSSSARARPKVCDGYRAWAVSDGDDLHLGGRRARDQDGPAKPWRTFGLCRRFGACNGGRDEEGQQRRSPAPQVAPRRRTSSHCDAVLTRGRALRETADFSALACADDFPMPTEQAQTVEAGVWRADRSRSAVGF